MSSIITSDTATTTHSECSICYEVIGDTNNCTTSCGHNFCFKCLLKAMRRNTTCPICRDPLVEPEQRNGRRVYNEVSDDENDDDDDEDGEGGDGEGGDDDEDEDDEDESDWDNYYENTYNSEKEASVEEIAQRLRDNNFTYEQLVGICISRYSSQETSSEIENLHDKIDFITFETDKEYEEKNEFAKEDLRYMKRRKEYEEKFDILLDCEEFVEELNKVGGRFYGNTEELDVDLLLSEFSNKSSKSK